MGRGSIRLPPFKNVATVLALVVVVASVIWKLAFDTGLNLYLVPGLVWSGGVWQLITWLPASAPVTGSVLWSAFIIWGTGGNLEAIWGRARFLRFMLGVTFLSGVLSVLVGLLPTPVQLEHFYGGNIFSSIAWVGWGCAMWRSQLNILGFSVTGKTLALFGVFVAFLDAVFFSPYQVVARAFALLLTFAYARWGFPGTLLERFGSWRLQRTLDKRASHLKSIDGGKRNVSGDSDKYLH